MVGCSSYCRVSLVLIPLVLALPARADLTVRFDAPLQSVGVGDVFTMDIVADIDPLEPILGWGLDLGFDSTILSLTQPPTVGSQWFAAAAADGDGLVGMAFPNSVSGLGVLLATLTFSADAIGMSGLSLSVTPGDLTEGFPLDAQGFANVIFQPSQVSVVPLPSAVLLGTIGFCVVGWVRRRGACPAHRLEHLLEASDE